MNHPNKPDREWGVVQKFQVEADTRTALVAAINILMTDHGKVTSWAERENELLLFWSDNEGLGHPLPTPLDDPKKVADLAADWLRQATYPSAPDTDGSTKKGYTAKLANGYLVARISPTWIVYGK